MLRRNHKLDLGDLADSMRKISLQRQALIYLKQYLVMSEHDNNLKRCAKEFHALCLKRTALRSLLLFKQKERESYARNATIRQFYHTNLKYKLFRFLHETNIEFI